MKLRNLELKDAPLMIEWMHDKKVVENLKTKFASKKISDCETFIVNSQRDRNNIHLAITNDADEYMGTVSLKNIDKKIGSAEFAITIRSKAMGKGFSNYAMKEIIRIGFEELKLKKIYWFVNVANKRAIHFYDKNGYKKVTFSSLNISINLKDVEKYIWYQIENANF